MNKLFRINDRGQGLAEYGLILALVSVVAVGALGGVGGKVSSTFSTVTDIDVQDKVDDGYVPITTADELHQIRKSGNHVGSYPVLQWQ